MNNFRPNTSTLYIERSRLLKKLPEESGYVVWLEAPYGYGKSVLAMHWADVLEKDDWRVVWLSLEGRDAKTTIADALGLPNFAPWGVVLDALWEESTLLVLEDLIGDEELSPILKHVHGLVLLASRKTLSYPELPHLVTERKLQHITTTDLAFSEEEAKLLFTDQSQATDYWQQTSGWSLPLHFASLTGEAPDQKSLLSGMKASISTAAWQESLFLAGIPNLAKEAGIEATTELVNTGFAQSLENAYRLHPMVAETVLSAFKEDIKQAVIAEAGRLQPLQQGEAFEAVGHIEGLELLLTTLEHELSATHPVKVLHWHSIVDSKKHTHEYLANLAIAQLQASQLEEGLATLDLILEDRSIFPEITLHVLGVAIFQLSNLGRKEEAQAYVDIVEPLEKEGSNYRRAHTCSFKAQFYLRSGQTSLAKQAYEDGLEYLSKSENPKAKKLEPLLKGNLIVLNSENGEIHYCLSNQKSLLNSKRDNLSPTMYSNLNLNMAVCYLNLNQIDKGKLHIDKALEKATGFLKLFGNVFKAYIEKDITRLTQLNQEAKRWNNNDISHRTSAILLRALRATGIEENAQIAFDLKEQITVGHHTNIEYAYFENAVGNKAKAEELLKSSENFADIDHKYVWYAANFIIMGDESSLDKVIELSTARDLLFHYLLIPLDALPKHRPELSRTYPLKEVLYSDWQEAIEYRLKDELPPLEINLLGEFNSLLLGDSIDLTDRLKQILCLLALGKSRDEVAATMWPEADAKKSRNNLNVQFNLLRKAIEPWGSSSYLFEEGLKNCSIDYQDLCKAINESDTDKVLSFYKEPFAPGLYLDAIEDIREQLRQDVIETLFEKVEDDIPEDKLRSYLERILELETTHEEALQRLLKILMKNGRRREANKRYTYFADQLEKEMGLEPLPSTQKILI